MLCRSCGRNSRTTDRCEFCKRPMASPGGAGAQPTVSMPAATPPTVRRVSLTGEVIETDALPRQPQMGPNQGPFPVQPTQAMPAQPYMNPIAAGLPINAVSPGALRASLGAYQPSIGEKWEKALAIGLPVLILSLLAIWLMPGALIGIIYADLFFLPLILGATGAIPGYDEAIQDCAIMLLLTLFLGPLVTLFLYGLLCAVRQETNTSVMAILCINAGIPLLLEWAFASQSDSANAFLLFHFFSITSFIGVFVSFVGWLLASFFRPLDED